MRCFNERLATSPRHVYPANLAVQFTGEPPDQVGVYRVDMVMRDAVRGIDLALRTPTS